MTGFILINLFLFIYSHTLLFIKYIYLHFIKHTYLIKSVIKYNQERSYKVLLFILSSLLGYPISQGVDFSS